MPFDFISDRERGERGGVGERGNTRRNRSRDRSRSSSPRSRRRSPDSHRGRRRSRSRSPKKLRSRRRKCSLYWDVPPPGLYTKFSILISLNLQNEFYL